MVTFWVWGIRNPCLLVAAVATASGLSGVIEWSLSLSVVAGLGIIADAANHLARHRRARQQRDRAAIVRQLDEARAARDRIHHQAA